MVPEVGLENTTDFTVAKEHTAAFIGSGDLEVLGTPALIAFLEKNCRDALRDLIPGDSTSVGIRLELDHLKASPLGAVVTCHSRVISAEDRLIRFEVRAESGGQLLAQGNHTRAIVSRDRFLAKLNK